MPTWKICFDCRKNDHDLADMALPHVDLIT